MGLTVLEGLVVEPQGTLILSFGEQVIPFLLELVEFLLMCVCVCVCVNRACECVMGSKGGSFWIVVVWDHARSHGIGPSVSRPASHTIEQSDQSHRKESTQSIKPIVYAWLAPPLHTVPH